MILQYSVLVFVDMGSGFICNYINSRKKTLLIYYFIIAIFMILFFALRGCCNAFNMYLLCMVIGFGSGISVIYITMSAEQFGTNLRATAAISIPNLVRGFLPLILLVFQGLRHPRVFNDYVTAAWVTGAIIMVIGFISVLYTQESYGKDLDFIEN